MSHRSAFFVPRPARPSVRAARNRLVQYSGRVVLLQPTYRVRSLTRDGALSTVHSVAYNIRSGAAGPR